MYFSYLAPYYPYNQLRKKFNNWKDCVGHYVYIKLHDDDTFIGYLESYDKGMLKIVIPMANEVHVYEDIPEKHIKVGFVVSQWIKIV